MRGKYVSRQWVVMCRNAIARGAMYDDLPEHRRVRDFLWNRGAVMLADDRQAVANDIEAVLDNAAARSLVCVPIDHSGKWEAILRLLRGTECHTSQHSGT